MGEELNVETVAKYMSGRIEGFSGSLTAEKTAAGQSNPTFILTHSTGKVVLRRKPSGELLKSAHAVDREFRVMAALADTDVPVPKMHFLCEDQDVIGSTFFVMEFIDGRNFMDPRVPDVTPETRRGMYNAMNAGLAALHSVDIQAVGLADFGKPGNYFARQISRWSGQYRTSETETIPAMNDLITWLDGNTPDDKTTSLVHGDWRIDNLMFAAQGADLVGIFDWELSTLGHPLADLGAQLMQWAMPVGLEGRGLDGVDRDALGIPEDREYIELYAKRAGLSDAPDMDFYVAFSFFRMAAILQGVKRRALDGNASNPAQALRLGAFVPIFAGKGLQIVNEE
ncbi:MAG: phosphotransferase family protein [Paracoccaceae bacterium]